MKKENLRLILVICTLILLVCGCSPQIKEPDPERISLAFQQWVGYGPLYLAQEKGFFAAEGIELLFVDEQLDSARRDAFKQDILDCESGTIDLLVVKRAQTAPIVAVMEIDHSVGSDGIVATEDIKKIEDLVGKKVAFARDNVGETFLAYLFYKNGLSLKDIIIIPHSPEDVWLAFVNGEADAAVTWEPWLSKAAQRPGAHILITTKQEPEIIIDTLNVREDIVKNNPQLVQKLMRGWFKAIKYCKQYPIEASEIIAKYYDITPEQYRKQIEGLKWDNYEIQVNADHNQRIRENFGVIAEIKYRNGRITNKPQAEKAIDWSLLKTLYENSQ